MSLLNELKRRNVVRVTAAYLVVGWLLTEVLTTILPTLGAPAWTSRTVILVFALGFVPTIVLSWIYQITPEGIKRDSDVSRDAESDHRNKIFDYVAIAGVMVLIFVLAFLGAQPPSDEELASASTVDNASVAVLPFVDMSPDQDNEYFSDGLTETLLHMLAQIPDLQVAARTSSFAFKGQNIDIRVIAEALHVAHVLEGSVQRYGDQVRITAQLIRAADGIHVWSSNWDRTIDDIFAIQDEIAAQVGKELSESILGTGIDPGTSSAGTEDAEAIQLYWSANSASATNSFRGLQAAESLLKGALAIDPNYLDAKTALADNYLHQFETGLLGESEAASQIGGMLDQALAVDPDDPDANAIRLYVQANTPLMAGEPANLAETISEFEQLVENEPMNHRIRSLLGRLLRGVHRYDEALALQLEGLDNDPYNAEIYYELAHLYSAQDKLDEARDAFSKSLELEPGQPNAYVQLGDLSRKNGDGADYVRQQLKAMAADPQDHEIPGFLAGFLYQLGLIEEGDDFRDRVDAIAPTSQVAYRIELLRAIATGDQTASIASARRAIVDDIDDRQLAYGSAVQHLLRVAAREGRVPEELAWLDEIAPGILDLDTASPPSKYRTARFVALEGLYVTLDEDEFQQYIEKLLQSSQELGANPLRDPVFQMSLLAMQGKSEEAITGAMANIFPESVLLHLNWRESGDLPQYREFSADDRVRAAMQNWESEQEIQAEQVRVFLADLSSSQ